MDLGIGAGTRDALSVSDIRPVSRGEVLAQFGVAVVLGETWETRVDARLGAAWFDFVQPLTRASGNIKDQSWTVRAAVDRAHVISRSFRVRAGVGVEYGEGRSWTDTRFYSDRGPNSFYSGGSVHLVLEHVLHPRLRLYGELMQSVYLTRAHDGSTATDFNWTGRATGLTVGTRWIVLRARAD